jgi:hypothetical protein
MGAHAASLARVEAIRSRLGAGPWRAAEVHALGWTARQVAWAVSQGRLVRVARGWLAEPPEGDDEGRFRARCHHALAAAPEGTVLFHTASSLVLGQWLPAGADLHVHLAHPSVRPRTVGDVRFHRVAVDRADTTVVGGLPVTTLERTAIDVARGQPFEQALVVLDSAARSMVVRDMGTDRVLRRPGDREASIAAARSGLARAMERQAGNRGIAGVRRALGFADPCSESPYESLTRARFILAGVPDAELAAPVLGASGRRYFADFLWRQFRVIGEADGWAKYGEGLRARDALKAERERQRDLEAAGWLVVRWDPSDPPHVVVARVMAALASRGAGF